LAGLASGNRISSDLLRLLQQGFRLVFRLQFRRVL
jgi:hypothetical protein